jgi:hypothetical protein
MTVRYAKLSSPVILWSGEKFCVVWSRGKSAWRVGSQVIKVFQGFHLYMDCSYCGRVMTG